MIYVVLYYLCEQHMRQHMIIIGGFCGVSNRYKTIGTKNRYNYQQPCLQFRVSYQFQNEMYVSAHISVPAVSR